VKRKPCPIKTWPSLLPTTCQDFCDRAGITDQQTCLGRRCQCCPSAGNEKQWHDIPYCKLRTLNLLVKREETNATLSLCFEDLW
jgi:hypothetical protein